MRFPSQESQGGKMQAVFMGAGDEGPASRVECRALSELSWVEGKWWRAARAMAQ